MLKMPAPTKIVKTKEYRAEPKIQKDYPGGELARGANKEDDLNGGSWSVQVGAYNRFAAAHLATGRAARFLPALRGAGVTV